MGEGEWRRSVVCCCPGGQYSTLKGCCSFMPHAAALTNTAPHSTFGSQRSPPTLPRSLAPPRRSPATALNRQMTVYFRRALTSRVLINDGNSILCYFPGRFPFRAIINPLSSHPRNMLSCPILSHSVLIPPFLQPPFPPQFVLSIR